MDRVRNDGMRSQMDEYNKIQRHKGMTERNGWVKLRVGKWWNEANLLRHITKIPIFCTHPDKNAYCHK